MKKYDKELVDIVYNHLLTNHYGEANGVERGEVAGFFGYTLREFRYITRQINLSPDYDKLVSTKSKCYICASKSECMATIKNTYRSAISLLKKAKVMEKKLGLQGQIRLSDKDLKTEIVEVFTENEND